MKSPHEPIEIVGGGLAGLLLGILAGRKGIPSILSEAGRYPRHRVCGEFLSGAGIEILREHGLLESLLERGARWGTEVAFFSKDEMLRRFALPRPALCLSRHAMDDTFAAIYRQLGGELREETRLRLDEEARPGLVLAVGRRRKPVDEGWRWFGLKIHARDVDLEADLEMHLHENGYVGACRIEEDRVNLCGLFRRTVDSEDGGLPSPRELLRGVAGSRLREKTERATFLEESQCAVAGLDLGPRSALEDDAFRIGDALTMIPPLTGNGMSMALESAAAAAVPLERYCSGEISWNEAVRLAGGNLDRDFETRLAWARRIQRGLFSPVGRPLLFAAGRFCSPIWSFGFRKTR